MTPFQDNLLLLTDSYKFTHWRQYPPGTTRVYSYLESRGGAYPGVVFFGLQYILKRYLAGVRVDEKRIAEAQRFCARHFEDGERVFNVNGWRHILNEHGGRLPVVMKAVPEGTYVPSYNVLMTVENTDPRAYWLTNYIETLLVQTWYGSTVATHSRAIRQRIAEYLDATGDPEQIDVKLHDFGFRGATTAEAAGIGGAAHLVNFTGTDTVAGVSCAEAFYGAAMPGVSIPAAEHSTMTAWGKEAERDAFANMLEQFPRGLVAVVSDSFDIFNACAHVWGEQLRDAVLTRNGTVVIRPDSGDPPEVVVRVLDILTEKFGSVTNNKGFKELPPQVRIIQGDQMDYDMVGSVLGAMKDAGYSANNIAFGMGGALLQKLNRDTQRFAFKCSYIEVNGEPRDVYKEPVTAPGKISKAGRLKLVRSESGAFETVGEHDPGEDRLVEVFRDGDIVREWSFDDIRARAADREA